MSLERFCRKEVVTAQPDDSAKHVAQRMRDEHVGCVIIVDGAASAVGVVTDRDLTVRVLASGMSLDAPISTFMTSDPVTIRQDQQLDDAVTLMREAGVRRLPIIDSAGSLTGMVSLDDINVLLSAELSASTAAIHDNRGP
jgi:signal-transduction protein with cAMP-binding, CBS, and nucleotidyltransferase domain